MPPGARAGLFHRKKSDREGSVYVLYESGYRTWQIRDAGIKYLLSKGYVAENIIPVHERLELKSRGWLYDLGKPWSADTATAQHSPTAFHRLHIASSAEDDGWQLFVSLPELDRTAGLNEQQLSSSGLLLSGRKVRLLDLWPGQGARRCPVAPPVVDLRIQKFGTWPETVDSSSYLKAVHRLNSSGSFFRPLASSWVYCLPGSELRWGDELLLLLHPEAELSSHAPAKLLGRPVGAIGDWSVYSIQLPEDEDRNIGNWVRSLSLAIVAQPDVLVPLSFPIGSSDNEAVFPQGQEILFRIIGRPVPHRNIRVIWDGNSRSDSRILLDYFAFTPDEVGRYEIRMESERRSIAYAFLVQESPEPSDVKPISVEIGEATYHAYSSADSDRIRVRADSLTRGVRIDSIVPVRARVSGPLGIRQLATMISPELSMELPSLAPLQGSGRVDSLSLDAGAFGSLSLDFFDEPEVAVPAAESRASLARWLKNMNMQRWPAELEGHARYLAVANKRGRSARK